MRPPPPTRRLDGRPPPPRPPHPARHPGHSAPRARFRVTLEYEGTRYSGWQVQKNARTVQGQILDSMRLVFDTDAFEFQGAGRTDAGVHALAQTAHLEVATALAPDIIRIKVNDELPADINLLRVEKAKPGFHARHDAVARSYLYQISRRRTALGKRYVWWVKDGLNAFRMRDALAPFVGMKDVRSFTDDDPEEKSTVVHIEEAVLREAGDLIVIRIVGSHFVWKLVRRIVGVVVEAGRGAIDPAGIEEMFRTPSDAAARLTAPPSGLFLERIYYAGEPRLKTLGPVVLGGSTYGEDAGAAQPPSRPPMARG